MRGPVQQASLSTQFSVWYRSIPIATGGVLAACCSIWLLGTLVGFRDLLSVCMSPYYVINEWQVWRFFTFPFFHVGLMHLLLNMMAWVPLGGSLERLVGSVQFAFLTLLFAALGATVHTCVAGVARGAGYTPSLAECAVGLSGVIFSLVVVDSHLSPQTQRSIFGLFVVPAKWYPVALLMFLQFLIPNASLVGHLSGLVIGYAYAWGWLNWAVLSPSAVTSFERASCLRSAVAQPNFIVMTGNHDARGGGLPRWILSGEREGSQWRFPAWLEAAWASARAGAANLRQAAGGREGGDAASGSEAHQFPGRAYTVGRAGATGGGGAAPPRAAGGAVPPPPPQPQAQAQAAAAASSHQGEGTAATALAEARARAARAAEARAAGMVPSTAAGSTTAPSSQQPSSTTPPSAQHQQHVGGAPPPGLRTLLEMGFPEAQARSALVAADGDIVLAIEIATAAAAA